MFKKLKGNVTITHQIQNINGELIVKGPFLNYGVKKHNN
jgi:hypothetical protein